MNGEEGPVVAHRRFVYRALGHDGTYYGTRLGKRIPWVEGFPFDVVSHPQYVGAVLTILGGVVIVYSPAVVAASLYPIIGVWLAGYATSAVSEQYL